MKSSIKKPKNIIKERLTLLNRARQVGFLYASLHWKSFKLKPDLPTCRVSHSKCIKVDPELWNCLGESIGKILQDKNTGKEWRKMGKIFGGYTSDGVLMSGDKKDCKSWTAKPYMIRSVSAVFSYDSKVHTIRVGNGGIHLKSQHLRGSRTRLQSKIL